MNRIIFPFTLPCLLSLSHSPSLSLSPQNLSISPVTHMKPNRKVRFSTGNPSQNDNSTPPISNKINQSSSLAAAKIQAAYRGHVVRTLVKKISAVKKEVDRLEMVIQRQETVDAVRSSEKEKLRIHEALMGQLLELDSVPGFDPAVRELRRNVSRRIVGLQEVMDGICGDRMDGWDGIWNWNWDEMIGEMEEQVCRERGGQELEEFCALNLGFRCLQRFLREG